MKKTISGVLLALTAVFALVACGKKTTTKEGETTTKKARKRSGKANIINFYCWNDEVQSRVNVFYGGTEQVKDDQGNGKTDDDGNPVMQGKKVASINGSTTKLTDGQTIQWTTATNQGSIYQDTLDIALDNNIVDMFCFEADYATKYVKSEYVLDLGAAGVDFSDQYKYTVDVVTNAEGKKVGSSWQATPGVIIYNDTIAQDVWAGADVAAVEAKIGDGYAKFVAAAAEVKAKSHKMVIGPASIYRLYSQNISAQMYDGKDTITVDKNLFNYAINAKELASNGYMAGTEDSFGQWQSGWGAEMSATGNTLCVFGCPWFVDFSFKNYRALPKTETDSGWKVCLPYQSFFWGGTWMAATQTSQQEATIKDKIIDIIKDMTTNKTILSEIHRDTKDFTNSKTEMNKLAEETDTYFGGSKVMSKYLASIQKADMSKASDFDQQIAEGFQAAFRTYIEGAAGATGTACWNSFVSSLKDKTSVKEVKAAAGVTIGDTITVA
jgi:hypothetical protein